MGRMHQSSRLLPCISGNCNKCVSFAQLVTLMNCWQHHIKTKVAESEKKNAEKFTFIGKFESWDILF